MDCIAIRSRESSNSLGKAGLDATDIGAQRPGGHGDAGAIERIV
jgi:hypothetical protein